MQGCPRIKVIEGGPASTLKRFRRKVVMAGSGPGVPSWLTVAVAWSCSVPLS